MQHLIKYQTGGGHKFPPWDCCCKAALSCTALCLPISKLLKRESQFKITLTETHKKSGNERRHMSCEEHIPNPHSKKRCYPGRISAKEGSW